MTTDDVIAAEAPQMVPLRRNRDFNLLWSGQAASALGTEISEIAYPLLILAVTGSAAKAGLVGAAGLVATLVTLLPAGVVADSYPRKRIMVVTSVAQLLVVGSVVPAVLTGHVWIAHLVAVGALQGVAGAFYSGASRGAVRKLVPKPQLSQALSRTQARDQGAYLIGPAVGGTLFGIARSLPFLLDSVSFGVIAVAAGLVRGQVDPDPGTAPVREPLRRSVTKGLRYVTGSRYLRTVAVWAAVINGLAMGMLLMIIVLVRYRGGGPEAVGLVSATGPVGGLIGALVAPRIVARVPGRTVVVLASWVMVLCPVGIALAPTPALIGVSGALAMFVTMPVNIVLQTRAAELTPHEMQAQTSNAMSLVGTSLKWLGPLAFGLAADRFGAVGTTLASAVVYVATAVWLQYQPVLYQLNEPAPEIT